MDLCGVQCAGDKCVLKLLFSSVFADLGAGPQDEAVGRSSSIPAPSLSGLAEMAPAQPLLLPPSRFLMEPGPVC